MRVLALDYGRARCGCAASDQTGVLATPLDPVPQPGSRRGLARLRKLVSELAIERVVVGLPVSLTGRDSAQSVETRAFARQLEAHLRVPVELYDERYTTCLAQRTDGVASEDSRAAGHLLESWLAARGASGAARGEAAEAADG
jgi:putative Holliday junction resolvase